MFNLYKNIKNIIIISIIIFIVIFLYKQFFEDMKNIILTYKVNLYSNVSQKITINKNNNLITIHVPLHKEYTLDIEGELCKIEGFNFKLNNKSSKGKVISTLNFFSNKDIPQYLDIEFKKNNICETKSVAIKSQLKIKKYFAIIYINEELKNILDIKNNKDKLRTNNKSFSEIVWKHNKTLFVIKYNYKPMEDVLVVNDFEKSFIKFNNN